MVKPGTPRAAETRVTAAIAMILAELATSGWPVGTVIGQEAEMIDRYRIGRGTFREAVKILEADGLLRMKQGRQGGLILEATPLEAARRSIETALRISEVPVMDVWTAESILMAEAAELAARNIKTQEIDELRKHARTRIHDLPDASSALHNRVRLRALIAGISGNSLLPVLLPALTRLAQAQVSASWLTLASNAPDIETSQAREQALVEAIVCGDVSLARQHVIGLVEFDRAKIAAAIAAGSIPSTVRSGAADPPGFSTSDLVYGVARQLAAEVAGYPPGTHIGTEEALAGRFSIGRGICRQALRIAERRGLIELRRGKGGGHFTASPSHDRAAEIAGAYLLHARIDPADAIGIAKAFDLAAAPAAACHGFAEGDGGDLLQAGLTRSRLSNWLADRGGNAVGLPLSRIFSQLRPDRDQPVSAGDAARLHRAIATCDAGVTRRIVSDLHRQGG